MTPQAIEALMADLTRSASHIVPIDFSTPEISAQYIEGLHGSDTDAVKMLSKRIKLSLGQSVQLFTGQPGSGKSTELYRLKKMLETDLSDEVRVFYLDAKSWVHLSKPVHLSSFLVGLLAAWVRQADEEVSRNWIERFYGFLSTTNVIPKGFKLELPNVFGAKLDLELALETDDDFRAQLDVAVKKLGRHFTEQAHTFIKSFKQELCGNHRKCVLLIDTLEQVRGYGQNQEEVYKSLQELFLGDRAALQLPDVHVVYSVSPFLYINNSQLAVQYGAGVIVNMPSVHVFRKELNEVSPDPEGLKRMRAFMSAKFPRWTQVLTEKQINQLILGTGGDLRDFLRAVEYVSLTDTDTLPIHDKRISETLSKIKPPYEAIHSAHFEWLKTVETTHQINASTQVSTVQMFQYLASKHVLTYLNGETWYSVHPLLRDWVLSK